VDYVNSSPNVAVDLTYIATPTLVNELNIGWASWSEDQALPNGTSELAAVQKSALGIRLGQFRPQVNRLGLIPVVTLGGGGLSSLPTIGFSGSAGARFPIHSQSSSYGLSDGLSKVWQGHISKAGIYVHIDRYVQLHVAGNFAGNYNFSVSNQNKYDSGNTFANALLGNFMQYQESTGAPDSDPFTRIFDWYVQDNWKIVKRFTLDYGLRFTWDIPQDLHIGATLCPIGTILRKHPSCTNPVPHPRSWLEPWSPDREIPSMVWCPLQTVIPYAVRACSSLRAWDSRGTCLETAKPPFAAAAESSTIRVRPPRRWET
jgi:hypothetical protein